MKKLLFFTLSFLFVLGACAQIKDPVRWSYKAVKKSDKVYDVIITATLSKPWHIYSVNTPDGGPVATKISFANNPLVTVVGDVKEVGRLKKEKDNIFNVDVWYYGDEVKFVQTVKLKSNIKTNLNANVNYMVCDDEQCLPPTKKSFDIKIQ